MHEEEMFMLDIKRAQEVLNNQGVKKKFEKKQEFELMQSMRLYDQRIKRNNDIKNKLKREAYQKFNGNN